MRAALVSAALLAGFLVGAAAGEPIGVGGTSCFLAFQASTHNLVCSVVVPGGAVTLDGSLAVVERAAAGGATRFAYDALGRLVRADGPGGTHSYAYDDAGQLVVRVDDSTGEATRYSYDALGRLTASGGTRLAYSFDNLRLEQAASDGAVTSYSYDGRGTLVEVEASAGESERFAYGGRWSLLTGAAGVETLEYTYDSKREPVLRRRNLVDATNFDFDVRGDVTQAIESDGKTTAFDYDRDGSLLRIDAAGATTSFAYDALGRLVRIAAADGSTITFAYDDAGRVALVHPDLGDEVLIAFQEGDPDQPYVLGAIYGGGESVTLTPEGRLITCSLCP